MFAMKDGDWRINRSPSMMPEAKKIKHQTLRKKIFDSLGGVCIRCGFSDERALQVDHVEGVLVAYHARGTGTYTR